MNLKPKYTYIVKMNLKELKYIHGLNEFNTLKSLEYFNELRNDIFIQDINGFKGNMSI